MSIYGNYVEESYIINEKDIFYHKKQFDNNDINFCSFLSNKRIW